MRRQPWECEQCGVSSAVDYPEGAHVYAVRNLLEDDHAAKSPRCDFGLSWVKVATDAE
jgi:hypothetical protein